jgi:hypothetical protein
MGVTTLQVTGSTSIFTTGATHIDNANTTHVPFAATFTNGGINHPNNSSLFNINVPGEYTINVQLHGVDGTTNDRGIYFAIVRKHKNRTNLTTRGSSFRDYYLENLLLQGQYYQS